MTLQEAEALAISMMTEEGLIGMMDDWGLDDWSFEFDNARHRLGGCHPSERKITLSRAMVELNDQATIREIMLHEIAHAILERRIDQLLAEWGDELGPITERNVRSKYKPHGAEWKAIAETIGATPNGRCASPDVVTVPARWVATCAACGSVYRRHRRKGGNTSCNCGGDDRYNPEFKLEWVAS